MIEAQVALDWCTRLAGLCAVILSAETLIDRRHYADDGLLGWPVMQSRHRALLYAWYAPALGALLRYPVFLVLTALRLVAGLLLIGLPTTSSAGTAMLGLATAMALLYQLRTTFGTDGADQMNTLTLGALFLAGLIDSDLMRSAVLWFLGLQLVLSYLIAGLAKLRGEEWRRGSAPWKIFATSMYGVPPFGLWLKRHPRSSWLMSWMVIVIESTFVLVFVVPRPVALAYLVGGIGFHLMNAALMGLNTFFWSFLAVYPALFWCLFPA